MENQELLAGIASLLEEMETRLITRMDAQKDELITRMDAQTEEIKQSIVENNVAIGETLTDALEPLNQELRDLRTDFNLLRWDNAQNTVDIARLKSAK